MSKKPLDDLFRDAFDAPGDGPSADLWQRLERRLDDRRAERKHGRGIRFLQPGVIVLTVALLLLAALAGWYFVKNHRPKTHPKPLIFNELDWIEGRWQGDFSGKKFETTISWANDSTLAYSDLLFERTDGRGKDTMPISVALVERGGRIFCESGPDTSVFRPERSRPGDEWFFEKTGGPGPDISRLLKLGRDTTLWLDETSGQRKENWFFRLK